MSVQNSPEAAVADPILYSFRRCPYAMRARMALHVSGMAAEHREVRLRDKPAELLEASPKGTVPVLVTGDGEVIDESLDIMRWALGQNDPEGWLSGVDDALIAANDGPFKHHLDRCKYDTRYDSDGAHHRSEAVAILTGLERRLEDGEYLCGNRRTLTDIAIFPFVRQFAGADRDWFDAQPLPQLQCWLARLLASDLFAAIMVKRDPWMSDA